MTVNPVDAPLQLDGDLNEADSGEMREQLEAWAVALVQDTSQPLPVRISSARLLNEVLASRPAEIANVGYWQAFGQVQAIEEMEAGEPAKSKRAPVLTMHRSRAPDDEKPT